LNCAPPVDSPHFISQQIIEATAPVGDFPRTQQAILSQSPLPFIGQDSSPIWLKALLITSTPHMIPSAEACPAKTRNINNAMARFSMTT
jgi:hypothetical protein